MTSATVGGVTTTYTYNGDGLRQSRTSGGVPTNYTWDVASGLPMLLQDGTNTYVYGLGLISIADASGAQTYPLKDGLGSTVALADASGAITGTYSYDVFGAVRAHTGGFTEFSFTGEQNDPNGLEYLRARYYDPATGRFLSRDPLGAAYRYANNNPVSFVDPSGLIALIDGCDGGGCSGNFSGGCADFAGDPPTVICAGPAGPPGPAEVIPQIDAPLPGAPDVSESAAPVELDLVNTTGIGVSGGSTGIAPPVPDCLSPVGCIQNCCGPHEPGLEEPACFGAICTIGEFLPNKAGNINNVALAEAEAMYPKLRGRLENHHVFPKYLGGPANGPTVRIPSAYHQLITNAFRSYWQYGQGAPAWGEARRIMEAVYGSYPVPY